MTWTVRALCTPVSAPGLALAGVDTVECDATQTRSADAALGAALARGDVGVLLIEAPIYELVSRDMLARLARKPLPMLVPFPSPSWAEGGAADYVVELLKRAIGYRVRLR